MENTPARAEAQRLLGVSAKLLHSRDLNGSREFAILAQENDPLLDGSDQILAVTDVLLSSEKRINNKHHDWYAILQIDRRTDDLDIIKKQYRRLALLLHPDKNKFAFADHAFKIVADAWAILSDSTKKSYYDSQLSLYSKVDLVAMNNSRAQAQTARDYSMQEKMAVRRSGRDKNSQWRTPQTAEEVRNSKSNNINSNSNSNSRKKDKEMSFWTACPYCYVLYEYPVVYEDCCMKCQNCQRGFHSAPIPSLPPLVPGKEAYYACWGFFPLGFVNLESDNGGGGKGFPNWMPPIFRNSNQGEAQPNVVGNRRGANVIDLSDGVVPPQQPRPPPPPLSVSDPGTKRKRGRPRKNPL